MRKFQTSAKQQPSAVNPSNTPTQQQPAPASTQVPRSFSVITNNVQPRATSAVTAKLSTKSRAHVETFRPITADDISMAISVISRAATTTPSPYSTHNNKSFTQRLPRTVTTSTFPSSAIAAIHQDEKSRNEYERTELLFLSNALPQKKITNTDLSAFLSRYFPTSNTTSTNDDESSSPKTAAFLSDSFLLIPHRDREGGTDDASVSRDFLHALLVGGSSGSGSGGAGKSFPQDFFDDAFSLIEPINQDFITDASLKRLIKCIDSVNKLTAAGGDMLRRGDLQALRERFDRDKDGVIGKDDWKKMNMAAPKSPH
ncbi:hypothetical protein HK100_003160 [Physocladia obscura]|uniref:EF-hand domain-containing protein n=1 Tax=Physocladia obscura TaxID=109957 RepID=A0AAD5XDD0_9FUNG|nr:hypothetical protein HK100_003160 [Physocladia obscura]